MHANNILCDTFVSNVRVHVYASNEGRLWHISEEGKSQEPVWIFCSGGSPAFWRATERSVCVCVCVCVCVSEIRSKTRDAATYLNICQGNITFRCYLCPWNVGIGFAVVIWVLCNEYFKQFVIWVVRHSTNMLKTRVHFNAHVMRGRVCLIFVSTYNGASHPCSASVMCPDSR